MAEEADGGGNGPENPSGSGAVARTEPKEEPTTSTVDPYAVPVDEVRELFLTVTKAIRAAQLYDRANPVYDRFISSLREALTSLWERIDRLEVLVEEERLLWHGEEVYRNENPKESLAFLCYRDGVRAFTFHAGVEEELESLLEVFHRARQVQRVHDDLITLLWELDLEHFDYSYVDYLAESVELPRVGDEGGAGVDLKPVFEEEVGGREEEGEAGGPAAPLEGQVSHEDFNPALYALEPSELESLRRELRRELDRDLRRDVLSALFDRLEDAPTLTRQVEILDILRTVLPNLLARGELAAAARILEELGSIREAGVLGDDANKRVDRLLDEVSAPESVDQLVQALEDGAIPADSEAVGQLLRHLQPRALEPLARATEKMGTGDHGDVLRDSIYALGAENHSAVVGLLTSHDPHVVAGAAWLAGRLGLDIGADELSELVEHEDPKVRLAVVEAAEDIGSSVVYEAITDLLTDPAREVRVAAARALGNGKYRRAAEAFRKVLQSRRLRQADLSEKMAFFESYGRLGDPGATPFLDRILNRRSFFLRRKPPELRACAALALGRVGTDDARASLKKAKVKGDPVVRNAVSRALRGEEG